MDIPTFPEIGLGGAFVLLWYLVKDTIAKNTEALKELKDTVNILRGYIEATK